MKQNSVYVAIRFFLSRLSLRSVNLFFQVERAVEIQSWMGDYEFERRCNRTEEQIRQERNESHFQHWSKVRESSEEQSAFVARLKEIEQERLELEGWNRTNGLKTEPAAAKKTPTPKKMDVVKFGCDRKPEEDPVAFFNHNLACTTCETNYKDPRKEIKQLALAAKG